MTRFIGQPESERLGDRIRECLSDKKWQRFVATIAFVKRSGVQYIFDGLTEFCKVGHVKIVVGIDSGGTSIEGLTLLLHALEGRGEVWVEP